MGPAGRSSSSAAGPGGSRCTWRGAGTGSIGLDIDPELVAALDERAGELPVDAVSRRCPGVRASSASSSLVLAPMQLVQLLGDADERSAACAASPRTCSPGGLAAFAIVEEHARARSTRPLPCPTCARSTAGSTRACRSRRRSTTARSRPPPAPDRLPRRRAERGAGRDPAASCWTPRRSSARRSGRAGAGRPPRDPAHRRPRRLDRRPAREGGLMELRAPRPLPRADEHLRRPRQHPLPAAALRVARDRLRLRRRRARRGPRPGAHDLLYLGGGQDRDQRAVAADMVASKREALGRGGRRRRRPARRLRRLPAARPQLPARRGAAARARPRRPGDGARAGPAADRQRRDRGRPRRGPADDRRLREPRRPHLPRRRRHPARPRPQGLRQQRRGRPRGRAPRQPDRHLPARPAAAQERLARRPPDRPGPRAPLRRSARAGAARRHASSGPPSTAPARSRCATEWQGNGSG